MPFLLAEAARIYAILTERLRGRLDAFDAVSNREEGGAIATGPAALVAQGSATVSA